MIPRWTEFVDKVIHWAERESNEKSVMFTVDKIDDNTIQITSRREKKVCRLKYSRREYNRARNKLSDGDILPILFQILKEKYKPVRWSVIGEGGKSFAWPKEIRSSR